MSWCVLRVDETDLATPGASTPGHSVAPSVVDEDFQSVAGETVVSFSLVDSHDIAVLDSLPASGDFCATSGEESAELPADCTVSPSASSEMAPKAAPGKSPTIMPYPWPYLIGPPPATGPPPTRLRQIPEDLPTEPPDTVPETSVSTPGEPQSLPALPHMPQQPPPPAMLLPPSVPPPPGMLVPPSVPQPPAESQPPSVPQAQGQPIEPAPRERQSTPWPQPPLRQTPTRPPKPVRPPPGLLDAQPGRVAASSALPTGASTPVMTVTVTDLDARSALLTLDDISSWRGNITCKRAHDWLHATRDKAARQPTESIDLSEHPLWRTYICSHPKAREIILNGIVRFEGRFLNSLEPNRQVLCLPAPYGEHRFDFVAVRKDGTAARLHPGSRRDAEVVVGRYQDWLLPDASTLGVASVSTPASSTGASSAGAARGAPVGIAERGVVYSNYSQVDVMSSQTALRHIMDKIHSYRKGGGQDEQLQEDLMDGALTPGGFEWHRFFMGRPWGLKLWTEHVTSLHLVWRGAPALMVRTAAHPNPRFVTWRGSTALLSGDSH